MIKRTNGEGAGDALTHWGTPAACTTGLVEYWPELLDGRDILEPSAGAGAIVSALIKAGASCVDAIEVNEDHIPALQAIKGIHRVTLGDYLQMDFPFPSEDWRGAIVQNPPYRPPHTMLRHVRRNFDLIDRDGGIIACLLPVSFLSGGSGRREFWQDVPPPTQILFFSQRPKFTDAGGMFEPIWIVWAFGYDPRPPKMIKMPSQQKSTFAW